MVEIVTVDEEGQQKGKAAVMFSSSSSTKNDEGVVGVKESEVKLNNHQHDDAVTSNNVDLKHSEEHVDDDICVEDFHSSPSTSSSATTSSSLFHRGIYRMKEMFHNLNGMEISGSLGDLGTFIPLTMALAKNRSIYIAPTLFFAGLSNLVTGIVWDVPMPVQPMKSISAVAIADVWTPQLMATSGITVGVLVLLLGLSNFMDLVNKIIPLSVVSGMQIGLGFRLMSTGMNDIVDLKIWVGNYGDCILVALLLSIGALFWLRELPQQHLDELRVLVDQQQNNNRRTAEERQQKEEIQRGPPNVSAFKDETTEKNASQCRPCSPSSDSTSSNTDEEEQRQIKTKETSTIDNEQAGTTTSPLLEAQNNSQMQDAFGTDSKQEPLLLSSDHPKDEKDVSLDYVVCAGISLHAVKEKTPPEENVIAPSSTLERTNQSLYRSVVDSGTKHIDEPDNHSEKKGGVHKTLSFILRCLCCCIPALGTPKNNNKKGTSNMTLHPVGVYLFLCGCIFAVVKLVSTRREDSETTGWSWFDAPVAVWALEGVVPNDWKVGLLEGAIPQLPLTTLNSVIAVCALCTALFPEKIPTTTKEPEREQTQQTTRSTSHRRWWIPKICQADEQQSDDVVTRRTVSISVGLMNLLLCPFGSMPNCHGAGGLAGQYRFGARTGTSVAFLGICKMVLSVFMGTSILLFLDAYPVSILGIMICISGSELAVTGWTVLAQHIQKQGDVEFNQQVQSILGLSSAQEEDDEESRLLTNNVRSKYYKTFMRQQVFVCLVTAAVMVGLGRTDIGVLSGWLANFIYADGYKPYMAFLKRCLPCCGGRKNNNESRTD